MDKKIFDSVAEQINKDLKGGTLKGEMMIISASGPTPFVPRDPDIRRGALLPIIVHPVTERKSSMELNEAVKAGVKLRIPLEMSEDDVARRMGLTPTISEKGMEMIKNLVPIAIDCQMNPDGSLSFGVVPPDTDHPPLMEVGGYSDKVKRHDHNPNVPKVLGEGDPLNIHRKMLVGKLRPEHKLDEILTQPLPEGKVLFSNLEDKKEEK